MKLKSLGLIACLINTIAVYCQHFEEKKASDFKTDKYDIFIIKKALLEKANTAFVLNDLNKNEIEFFKNISDSSYFAITASIVDSTCTPLGLFINNGKEINKINLIKSGKGNFFMPENGILQLSYKNLFSIVRSKFYSPDTSIRLAVQTGPLLIWDGGLNAGFDPNSKNKNIRCGVGIFSLKGEEYIIFAKSLTPVTFYNFASLFRDAYQCHTALNIESGTSCSMHLPGGSTFYSDSNIICRYLKINF